MVSAWQDLREREAVLFFEACEAMFLVAMVSLKKMLFELGSLNWRKR